MRFSKSLFHRVLYISALKQTHTHTQTVIHSLTHSAISPPKWKVKLPVPTVNNSYIIKIEISQSKNNTFLAIKRQHKSSRSLSAMQRHLLFIGIHLRHHFWGKSSEWAGGAVGPLAVSVRPFAGPGPVAVWLGWALTLEGSWRHELVIHVVHVVWQEEGLGRSAAAHEAGV